MKLYILSILLICSCSQPNIESNKNYYNQIADKTFNQTEKNLKSFFLEKASIIGAANKEYDEAKNGTDTIFDWHFIMQQYSATLRIIEILKLGIIEFEVDKKEMFFTEKLYLEELDLFFQQINKYTIISKIDKSEFDSARDLFKIKSYKYRVLYMKELRLFFLSYSYNKLNYYEWLLPVYEAEENQTIYNK